MKREDVPVEQDSLDNPVWHQNFDLKGVPADEHDMGSSIPAVRILGGGLDFLHGIEHDLLDWAKHVAKDGQEPDELPEWIRKNLPYRMNKIEVTSDANPAASFLCQTFTIPAATTPAAPTLTAMAAEACTTAVDIVAAADIAVTAGDTIRAPTLTRSASEAEASFARSPRS